MVAIFGRLQRLGLLGLVRSLLCLLLRLDHDRLCDVRARVRVGIRVGVRVGVGVGVRVGVGVKVRVGASRLTCATASTRSVKRVVSVAASGGVVKSSVLSSSSLAFAAGSEDRNQPG